MKACGQHCAIPTEAEQNATPQNHTAPDSSKTQAGQHEFHALRLQSLAALEMSGSVEENKIPTHTLCRSVCTPARVTPDTNLKAKTSLKGTLLSYLKIQHAQ